MNTRIEMLGRLLRLFPVNLIKSHFEQTGKLDDIVKIILASHPEASIFKFATENINYTRQHIFIFEIKPKFDYKAFNFNKFPIVHIHAEISRNLAFITCLPIVDFDVIVTKPYKEDTIQFFQPFKLRLLDDHAILQLTTLEKNLSHFYDGDRKVVDIVRKGGEDALLSAVLDFLDKKGFTVIPCDIHKGIKKLWEDGTIDSKYMKSKKSRSTDSIVMNEDYTIKDSYPEQFKELMGKPIIKTLFKYKGKIDGYFCDHFNADPENGQLGFASFSDNYNQFENLLSEILRNNK